MIPTFIDIQELEQCEELREYFIGLGANISKENTTEGFHRDLEQIINVVDTCFNDESNEKESDIECVLNSIVSLLIQVPQEHNSSLVTSFCNKLNDIPQEMCSSIRLRVLQNLFEGLPESILRYNVYYCLIQIAGAGKQISLVYDDMTKIKSWFNHASVGVEKVQKLYRLLHDALLQNDKSELASKVMIELLSTYTEENASQAREDAHRCIVTFISDQNTFLMDHLLTLKPVKFLEGEPIHDLLTIFVSEKLNAYLNFYNNHQSFVDSLELSHENNMKKMRLLTFMQMAENKKEITFSDITNELKLNEDQVEPFIIDVLSTKLVKAKIDQLNSKIIVSSTMHRTFGKLQWQQLKEILTQWKKNLDFVDHSINGSIPLMSHMVK